jgi:hypothetical protein
MSEHEKPWGGFCVSEIDIKRRYKAFIHSFISQDWDCCKFLLSGKQAKRKGFWRPFAFMPSTSGVWIRSKEPVNNGLCPLPDFFWIEGVIHDMSDITRLALVYVM